MPLTPADVRNKQFSSTRLRPGYDEEEVRAFLDQAGAELERLLQENQQLRAKLAECLGGGTPAVHAPSRALAAPGVEAVAAGPVLPGPQRMPEQPVTGMAAQEPSTDSAARVLVLAQQAADQALADARREARETLGRARQAADEVLGTARSQAEQITSDAQTLAESLQRDAQERYHQAVSSLMHEREQLERRVDDLRAFEHEYRSRLQTYLEGRLRDLQTEAADSEPSQPDPATGGHIIGRLELAHGRSAGSCRSSTGVVLGAQRRVSSGRRTGIASPGRRRGRGGTPSHREHAGGRGVSAAGPRLPGDHPAAHVAARKPWQAGPGMSTAMTCQYVSQARCRVIAGALSGLAAG